MRQVSTNLILSYNSSMYLLLHSNLKKKRTIYSHAHNIKEKFLLTMKPIVSHLFSIGYTINVIIIINPGHVLPASFFLPPTSRPLGQSLRFYFYKQREVYGPNCQIGQINSNVN